MVLALLSASAQVLCPGRASPVVGTEILHNLLHLESTTYYSLNSTGTRIWQNLKQGLPLRQISQQLQVEFAVEAEWADQSGLTFIEALFQHQLMLGVET